MGLKKTRNILSLILSVIIAASTVITTFAFVLNITYGTSSYFINNLITDELVSACDEQLSLKYEVLAEKSGIPARVFETVKSDSGTRNSMELAVSNLFGEESSTLYSEERVNYFYKLCTEYLDGNEIEYKKENIRLVGTEAARIYSDCVGIHGAEEIGKFLSRYKQTSARIVSAGAITITICIILSILLYKKKEEASIKICGGLAGGGFATIIGSLMLIILKSGSNIVFYPYLYQQSIYAMTRHCYLYMLLTGVAVVIVSYVFIVLFCKRLNKDKKRQKARFSKVIGRL